MDELNHDFQALALEGRAMGEVRHRGEEFRVDLVDWKTQSVSKHPRQPVSVAFAAAADGQEVLGDGRLWEGRTKGDLPGPVEGQCMGRLRWGPCLHCVQNDH